jgi:GT2 family glycosyltransferase
VKHWKYIKYPMLFVGGHRYHNLKAMHFLMYGYWEKYTEARHEKFQARTIEDFSGSCVLITRKGLALVGGKWDERMQAADFDMYMQVRARSIDFKDVRPMQVALGVYFHHYARLTLRSKHYLPFADANNLISIEQKWGDRRISLLEKLDTDTGKST